MGARKTNSIQSQPDFTEFWKQFHVLPWKWAEALASNPIYLAGSAMYMYIVVVVLTYFPTDRFAPLMGDDLPLHRYPSAHLFLIGWMLAVTLMVRWRHTIPHFFQWLYDSRRIRARQGDVAAEYSQYLQEYQRELRNKRIPLILGTLLAAVYVGLIQWSGLIPYLLRYFTPTATALLILCVPIGLFWMFMVGMFSWVLYVTATFIGKLTNRFDLDIQPSHPDKCGGLKPLGDFCLGAAVPLVFGGLAMVAVPFLPWDATNSLRVFAVTFVFVVVAPLTAIAVFLPIWNVHLEMERYRKAYADEYAQRALSLEKAAFMNTGQKGELNKAKTASEKLEILRSLHPDRLDYPVWPLRFTRTVLAAFSPQLLTTLLGIITTILNFASNP